MARSAPNAFTSWSYQPPMGVGQPGSIVGSAPPEPFFRSLMDMRLSMWRRTPDATYPDGYLGTIVSRRGDRLLDNLKARQNERSYQRGVHKGERVDPGDYFWPPEFKPDNGLKAEAMGIRQAPVGTWPTHLVAEGKMQPPPVPAGSEAVTLIDPHRQAQLRRLAPTARL